MELVLLIGLQASGKTRFFQTRFAATHVHLSKDLWPNARNREAHLRRRLGSALAEGRSVVIDNTNASEAARAPLIAIGREHGSRVIGYDFESRLRDCLERNARRPGRARVPDVALYATARRLEEPRLAEGFDALFHVRMAEAGGFEVTPWGERNPQP